MSILPSQSEKPQFVAGMFARIAPGYDRTNRVMTLGMDQEWRRIVVEAVAPPFNGRALDVGTGTGDFLPLLADWMPHGLAVGVDFCLPMMVAGQAKLVGYARNNSAHPTGALAFTAGDALRLPFPDCSFDAITTGFVMRNVADIGAAFREMWRVTRPGGIVACLEVARPQNPLLRLGHRAYFEGLVPLLGGFLAGDRVAYRYLPQSARAFPAPGRLAQIMRDAGWVFVSYRRLGLGAVAIHVGARVEV